ncbi:uncharacterized protein LOC131874614 isoform X2 [Cryptomeria japonica]|uniref:uncharacterized protein LOC131874614 isoform X2 n=1 Tax=Cryptomeria japonica TaxID=3369 RepID=UPI0027D9E911|nr:uncharacterized protein LOC131874614 isoform X2 [Cryptomeria japonica]
MFKIRRLDTGDKGFHFGHAVQRTCCYLDQPVVDLYLPMWAKHQHLANKSAFKWVDEAGNEQCSLTYSELHASASTIASNLRSTLQRSDTVLILCPPGIEFVGIIFGCQRAGLVSVPMASSSSILLFSAAGALNTSPSTGSSAPPAT